MRGRVLEWGLTWLTDFVGGMGKWWIIYERQKEVKLRNIPKFRRLWESIWLDAVKEFRIGQ
jgi:hypothetical protein